MKNLEYFWSCLEKIKKIQFWVMKSSFFEHFYDLTGPKYAEKYEDSESGLKSIHFLPKMISCCWFSFFMTCSIFEYTKLLGTSSWTPFWYSQASKPSNLMSFWCKNFWKWKIDQSTWICSLCFRPSPSQPKSSPKS